MIPGGWDPGCYGAFAEERARPFYDLLALVERRADMRVLDLGCGTGALTAELHGRLGAAETLGIDADPAMLARAEPGPGLCFERADIEGFLARPEARGAFDLVFSNAALHWVGDHERLMAALCRTLSPGGQLAFQVPENHDHPAHRAADEVAREERFARASGGYQRGVPVLDLRRYAEILYGLGLRPPEARARIYLHELESRRDVLAWLRGSLLTAYAARMTEAEFEAYSARLEERLGEVLADDRPYLYTYKRILVWGRAPGASAPGASAPGASAPGASAPVAPAR